MSILVRAEDRLRTLFSPRERRLRALVRQAHAWRSALLEDDGNNEAFAEWLMRSPNHVKAWLDVTALDEELARLLGFPALGGIVAPVPKEEGQGSAPELAPSRKPGVYKPRRRKVFAYGAAVAASVCTLAVGTLIILGIVGSNRWESVSTAIGEHRLVMLQDGTRLHLNTQTRAQWRFTNNERSVRLLEGEALLDIGKDPRPFRVRRGETLIEDVGTAFSVRLHDDSVEVVVVDGRIRVGSGQPGKDEGSFAAQSPVKEVDRGQSATVAPGGRTIATRTMSDLDITSRLAWTTGQLLFNGDRLEEIVVEFNRYNRRQLVIDSRCMNDWRIGGRYDATDPDGFARAIHSLGARITKQKEPRSDESIHISHDCRGVGPAFEHGG